MFFSSKKKERPKDTIGRILDSSPTPPSKITQTKKPKNLLKPWESREKELVFEFTPPLNPDVASSSPPAMSPPSYTASVTPQNQNIVQVDTAGPKTEASISTAQIGWVMAGIAGAKIAYDYYNQGVVKKSGSS